LSLTIRHTGLASITACNTGTRKAALDSGNHLIDERVWSRLLAA
jgi:hypothetical protein